MLPLFPDCTDSFLPTSSPDSTPNEGLFPIGTWDEGKDTVFCNRGGAIFASYYYVSVLSLGSLAAKLRLRLDLNSSKLPNLHNLTTAT